MAFKPAQMVQGKKATGSIIWHTEKGSSTMQTGTSKIESDEDKAHGYRIYKHKDEALYKGQWADDLQHGEGKESWPKKSSFSGNYKCGTKHG
jgi:hypothetical protein